jgi:hypothetical protein
MSGARYHTIISMQDYQDETLEQLMAERDADGIARHVPFVESTGVSVSEMALSTHTPLPAVRLGRQRVRRPRHSRYASYGEYHDEPRELGFLPDYSITGHVIPNAGSYVLMVNYGLGDASLLMQA